MYSSILDVSEKNSYLVPNQDLRGNGPPYVKASGFLDASAAVDPAVLTGSGIQMAMIPSPISGKYIHLPDGNVTAPGLAWAGEVTSGLYRIGSANFGQSVLGSLKWDWNATRLKLASGFSLDITDMTAGSVLFAGTGGRVSQDNTAFFFDDSSDFLRLTSTLGKQLRLSNGANTSDFTTDTSGALTITTSGSSVILPYLTPGSVLFAGTSGKINQDNANLFWDDTNNRLGIGCTNPWRSLEVRHASLPQMVLSKDDDNAATFQASGTGVIFSGYTLSAGEMPFWSIQNDINGLLEFGVYNTRTSAGGTGAAKMLLQIASTQSGDVYHQLYNGTTLWTFGLDNSDSDKWKLSKSATLGTTDYLTVYTTGDVAFGTGSLYWDNTNNTLQLSSTVGPYLSLSPVGNGTTGEFIMKLDPSQSSTANFNMIMAEKSNSTDPRNNVHFKFGYNIDKFSNTPENTAEPAYYLAIESFFQTGADYAVEVYFEYLSASVTPTLLRPWSAGISRLTDEIKAVYYSSNAHYFYSSGQIPGTTLWMQLDPNGLTIDPNVATSLKLTHKFTNSTTTPIHEWIQSSSGDAATRWTLSGANSYIAGIDNSDSDKWKLSYGSAGNAALGTNDLITVTTAGAMGLGISPTEVLDVNHASRSVLRIALASAVVGYVSHANVLFSGSASSDFGFLAAGNMELGTNSSRLCLRLDTGRGVAVDFQANGQKRTSQAITELLTIAAAATTDTTLQIPANAVVWGVSVRTTTVIPTAATYTVTGATSGTAFNTAAVSTAANSTDPGTKAGAFYNATAQSIRITPNVNPAAATGVVRVTVHYYTITPATS